MENVNNNFEEYMAKHMERFKEKYEEEQKARGMVKWISEDGSESWWPEGETPVYRNEKQKENYKKHCKEIEGIKEFTDEQGAFVNLIFKYGSIIFKEIEDRAEGNKGNIHVIRFIMLAAKTNYEGELMNNRKRIKKSDLSKIWDTTSKNSINDTYKILKDCGYISESEEGYLMINKDMVIKGAMDHMKVLKKDDGSYTFKRLFVDNIEAMYQGTEPKQRKQLANLFKALPYINFKYNVFCSNPTEEDETKVETLNWKQLAELCGCDKSHSAKFKKDLMSLTINGQNVIGTFETKSGISIIVNPIIYYGGNNIEDVNGLQALFRIKPTKNN